MPVLNLEPVDFPLAHKTVHETIQYRLRHPFYDRMVYMADWSYAMMTGEGQTTIDIIRAFRPKEDFQQTKQRITLTNSLTGFALNPIYLLYKKVHRVDNIRADKEHEAAEEQLEAIEEVTKTFHQGQDVEVYLNNRLLHMNFYDPNAWILTERADTRGLDGEITKLISYPFEVTAEQAINFEYENGEPKWLIVEHKRIEIVREFDEVTKEFTIHEHEVSTYYFYAAGIQVVYYEYVKDNPQDALFYTTIFDINNKERTFAVYENETGSTEFPGDKAGFYFDPYANQPDVFVPPYFPAQSVLTDLIWDKSSLDVTKRKHVYAKKYAYVPRCDYVSPDQGTYCVNGTMYDHDNREHGTCPSCNGTGSAIHHGELDLIEFKLNPNIDDPSKLVKLQDLFAYEDLPEWLPRFLDEQVDKDRSRIFIAIFNSVSEEAPLVTKTATEVTFGWEQVNNVVSDYARGYSRMFEKIYRVTAQYLEKQEGFNVNHQFPNDLKLEPLGVLIQRYEAAKTAGLSYPILWAIQCDILNKLYKNDPNKIANIKAQELHRPFRSMSTENAFEVSRGRDQLDHARILLENFDLIFTRIDQKLTPENPFYKIAYDGQVEMIEAEIEILSEEIKYSSQFNTADELDGIFNDNEGEEDEEDDVNDNDDRQTQRAKDDDEDDNDE